MNSQFNNEGPYLGEHNHLTWIKEQHQSSLTSKNYTTSKNRKNDSPFHFLAASQTASDLVFSRSVWLCELYGNMLQM